MRQPLSLHAGLPQLANPFLESLGVRLVHWSEGEVEMHLPLVPSLLNRSGVVQGGVICTLLDAVAGYAGLYTPPGEPRLHGLTLSLTSNFLANGRGELLIGRGTTDKRGNGIYFSRAEVWLDKVLLATALGTFRYTRSN